MTDWLVLAAALPAHPSALRVRVWRALKATGAGTLREGVYLLPQSAPTAGALWQLERTIADAGADAHLLVVAARDATQEAAFRALFDRSALYAELLQTIKETRSALGSASEAALHKTLRGLDQQFAAVRATDFFPARPAERAAAALTALRREIEARLSPGEPTPKAAAIEPLPVEDFQGRTWATRRRPWVDRLATAWLVQRFIDRSPRFVWLADPARCPKTALGYDFDGARFSHVGERVTFEVVARSFGLDADPALQRLGQIVHFIDVGGVPVDEAAGIEALVRGLQAQHPNDDTLLTAALPVFDTLYTAMKVPA
ncbi:chromate resistance protein ChrB domain-containing protein [Ideonella sp.]|uniref:chromate resistance protein ChrB domain-containing protein n=1 Tax=Ideonella sp. TaxID=1929293 RepID=UPI002B488FC7|nr:chromate resistance protein ChrB domain-containing protein [Ideonella sp.]HJV71902.1 chromate resistance protein ChrB domain-containing protein [Ideonella sp.]